MSGSSSPRRRVLVTGAAGFLGRHVTAALLADGWEVSALVHRRGLPDGLVNDRLRVIHADVDDTGTLRRAVEPVAAVVHLAAYIPPDHRNLGYADACLRTNALATLRLAELAGDRPGQRFIYASAGNAYAPAAGPATEASPLYPADRATCYLASKLLGELYVEHLRRARGLPAVSLRISSPFGPGMPAGSVVAYFMDRARRGQPLEVRDGGIPRYDFVDVADVAGVVRAAVESGEPGVYNVGSGVSHSLLDLARAVVETFPERRVPVEVEPPRGAPPASFPVLAIGKAAATWGYRPRPLRAGLAAYRRALEQAAGESEAGVGGSLGQAAPLAEADRR